MPGRPPTTQRQTTRWRSVQFDVRYEHEKEAVERERKKCIVGIV